MPAGNQPQTLATMNNNHEQEMGGWAGLGAGTWRAAAGAAGCRLAERLAGQPGREAPDAGVPPSTPRCCPGALIFWTWAAALVAVPAWMACFVWMIEDGMLSACSA